MAILIAPTMIAVATMPARTSKFTWPARARQRTNRFGDRYRVWPLAGTGLEVVETRSICGVACGRHFYVGRSTGGHAQEILSRHRKRSAAMRAAEQLFNREAKHGKR